MPAPYRFVLVLFLAGAVAACSVPPEGEGAGVDAPEGPVATDSRVRTLQLYRTGDEVSLPVISLRDARTLTLEFDILDDRGGRPLDIEFRRVDRGGGSTLLPTEYLTAFDRDAIFDADASGGTAIPYTHFEYTFPNATIGFKLGGMYRLRVSEPGGGALFDLPFFVSEELVETEVLLGARLAETGAVGVSVQPSARLTPRAELDGADAYRFTVCFARDGAVGALRCAPEPSLAELAIYGFYLPRAQAFAPATPLYRLDLGILGANQEITEVDYGARPPTALLEPDVAAFGGEVLDPTLLTASQIDAGFRDGGRGDDDAEYVEVAFRYVPLGDKQLNGPVYVRGGFSGGVTSPATRMTWNAEAKRYEHRLLVKQGVYAYDYVAPRAADRQRPVALGQPAVYTAFVFYEDLTLFTERLVGVTSTVRR